MALLAPAAAREPDSPRGRTRLDRRPFEAVLHQAEAILREGRADLIGMARALLADPDLPRKWYAGADADLRACVFCPFCEEEDQRHRVVTCTLWPKGPGGPRSRLTPAVWLPGAPWNSRQVFSFADATRVTTS